MFVRSAHAPTGGAPHAGLRGRVACDPAGHAACGMTTHYLNRVTSEISAVSLDGGSLTIHTR
jgi:hypothetical protein